MPDFRHELTLPGLEPRLRGLCTLTAAIATPDWDRFCGATQAAKLLELDREEFSEGLLQATLFFGFPRTVTAFGKFEELWPPSAHRKPTPSTPPSQATQRGSALFDAIYGKNAPTVHAMLESFHPEFHAFVIDSAYGRVLARDAIPPGDRELMAIAALAALDQVPQLIAHARGALHFGKTHAELRETLHIARTDAHAAQVIEQWLNRIGGTNSSDRI